MKKPYKKTCLKNLEVRLRYDKPEFDRIKREVKAQVKKVKVKLKKMNEDKVQFLEDKYGMKKVNECFGLTEAEICKYGECKVFSKGGISVKGEPYEAICVGDGEDGGRPNVSEDEKNLLKLGQKFCVIGKLDEEKCEVDIEECITKLKWDIMGEELKNVKEDQAMKAIMEVIDQSQREDLEEHERRLEGEADQNVEAHVEANTGQN